VTLDTSVRSNHAHAQLILTTINLHTKFEVSSFAYYKDVTGSQN